MASRVGSLTDFGPLSPPWNLTALDQNSTNIAAAFNDSSLGYVNAATDIGTANNYIVSPTFGSVTAYNQGMTFAFVAANSNIGGIGGSGASTITVSPLGSVQILDIEGNPLVFGSLQAGALIALIYVGTAFRWIGSGATKLVYVLNAGNTNTTLNCAGYTSLFLNTQYATASSTYTLTLNNLAIGTYIFWSHVWQSGSQHLICAPFIDNGTTAYGTSQDFNANNNTITSFASPGITRPIGTQSFFQGSTTSGSTISLDAVLTLIENHT
jgi:hypothetical protein